MSSFFSNLKANVESLFSFRTDTPGIHPCPANQYIWDYPTSINPLAVAKIVPPCDLPTLDWTLKVAETLLVSIGNDIQIEASAAKKAELQGKLDTLKTAVASRTVTVELMESIATDVTDHGVVAGANDHPNSLDDYNDLFKRIALPAIATDFQDDEVFAWLRVGGANPLMITRCSAIPDKLPKDLAQRVQRPLGADSLEAARKEGRLYIVDFAPLADLHVDPAGKYPQKYLYAPIALFVEQPATGKLLPIGIQTQQTFEGNNFFVPDGTPSWLIAKTIVQMADVNFHEAVSHLGRTHFLVEPFVIATARILGREHSVSRLLWPHFEGTLLINWAATRTLVAPGGGVEQILMPKLSDTLKLTAANLQNSPINDQFLPKTFAQRGVEDLKNYPYRDDSKLYWSAIGAWVKEYVELFYSGDENQGNTKVQADKLLQAWCREVIESGHVVGFGEGGQIKTRMYLIDALTMIIFTASTQHAAVNFPQLNFFTYSPASPGALYAKFPKDTPATEQDYFDMLPNRTQAIAQIKLAFLLGSVHYTELGQYPSNYFSGVGVQMVQRFQANIAAAGKTIDSRNVTRRPYTTLLPRAIPQSINI